ncbi:MUB1/samB family protein [Pleurotus pulmonarius]
MARINGPLGTLRGGAPIYRAHCSGFLDGQPCSGTGSSFCSKCRLVAYCSKDCQAVDWKRHKADCNSPYLKPTWKPAWIVESRLPACAGSDEQSLFGIQGVHLWGNVPAIDCLNIAKNEQGAAKTMDFDLCFAASGDIRNMVRTVNGLPIDYVGRCKILLNDRNPVIVARNILILHTLLADDHTPQEAAEAAVHLMYSSFLSREIADHLQHSLMDILDNNDVFSRPMFELNIEGNGRLNSVSHPTVISFLDTLVTVVYSRSAAAQSRDGVMMAPSRIDYLDRHLSLLRPPHRLSFLRNRKTGILAPFGTDVAHFTEPNKLMFSPDGVWLAADSADPICGWDAVSVSSTGKEHGLDPGDIYGALFFHTKKEFMTFAQRVRRQRISIFVTLFDAIDLPSHLSPGLLPFEKFDRIETSNLCDFVGFIPILDKWHNLLKPTPHATLLANSMNWRLEQDPPMPLRSRFPTYEKVLGISISELMLTIGTSPPNLFLFMNNVGAFDEKDKAFEDHLLKKNVSSGASKYGLRMRPADSLCIHPKRLGLSLNTPSKSMSDLSKEEYYTVFTLGNVEHTIRFLEFERL